MPDSPDTAHERMTFHGTLDGAEFTEWACHRAAKLGLAARVRATGETVVADVSGPAELIEAMALCCSLGPASCWVERVKREPRTTHHDGTQAPRARHPP